MTKLMIVNIYNSNIGKFVGAVLASSARQQQRAGRKIRRILFMLMFICCEGRIEVVELNYKSRVETSMLHEPNTIKY